MGGITVGGALIFVFLNFVDFHRAGAIRFEMASGESKCITEEIKLNAMSIGKYFVVDYTSEDQLITVRVTSPYASLVGYVGHLHLGEDVESGSFAFTALQQGDYLTCFWLSKRYQNPPVRVTVDFQWNTGVSTKDWNLVAKKGHINAMEMELRKMEDMVESIHEEMLYLREREEEMQDLNRKISSRMAWFSFWSLLVIVSVAGLQLWYLKNFFQKKKLV